MATATATRRLLGGLVVVSLEQAVAAPFCTSKLADQGARVIKVERRPAGDFARQYDRNASGASSYFAWLNRGKESFTADIKADGDREALQKLITNKADVFVQNLAPGAAERAGFGSEYLRELNPRLITLDISGYGDEGPRSSYKAYDLLVAAEAGLCDGT
ncbi:Succinate--hydroxymethylglutarate CoA-transferase [Hondaea fermentalgiana]|uniref:Succinate--hydroxymethylglutarate CoA-transferase n=1 Tax=Hondaea fermentalgiana TaxID=2315210 RepID=A0A2R5G754_9STRA|nr:Succinate--hydroxymethylglutarate CoA-transferase [Hondaea fermentalgiana]|eukprot:GBG23871.1 Succinate--hydroxymethylglutarate CoA-transferase [Hondaea fermentalgiana]